MNGFEACRGGQGLQPAWAAALCAWGVLVVAANAAVFHVDDQQGDDDASGRTPAEAWRTLERVNRADLRPGDRVAFRRGGIWRGQLRPCSDAPGAPVTYAAYGEGPLPRLFGSVAADRMEDWRPAGSNLWTTVPPEFPILGTPRAILAEHWHLYTEAGAAVRRSPSGLALTGAVPGAAQNHVQLWTAGLPVVAGRHYRLQMQLCVEGDVAPFDVALMQPGPPYASFAPRARIAPPPPGRTRTAWGCFSAPYPRPARA